MEAEGGDAKAVERIKNRYLLVNVVAERVKALKKKPTFSKVEVDGTLINRALQEVAEGKVKLKNSSPDPSHPSAPQDAEQGGDNPWAA